MPRINLLPWREAQRKRRRQEFAAGALGAILFAAVIYFIFNLQMQSAIDRQNQRNQYLTGEIAALDKQIKEIENLEAQRRRLVERMRVIEQLELSRPEIVHVFDQLVRTTPDGVYLTSVKQTGRRLELRGVAQSSTRVATYMRNIDGSPWLAEPALQILQNRSAADGGSQFTLLASQRNPQDALDEAAQEQTAATGGAP